MGDFTIRRLKEENSLDFMGLLLTQGKQYRVSNSFVLSELLRRCLKVNNFYILIYVFGLWSLIFNFS